MTSCANCGLHPVVRRRRCQRCLDGWQCTAFVDERVINGHTLHGRRCIVMGSEMVVIGGKTLCPRHAREFMDRAEPCPIPGCRGVREEARHVMCRDCWRLVDQPLQGRFHRALNVRNRVAARGTRGELESAVEAYEQARNEAIACALRGATAEGRAA